MFGERCRHHGRHHSTGAGAELVAGEDVERVATVSAITPLLAVIPLPVGCEMLIEFSSRQVWRSFGGHS